jgi:hypothetical protein
MFSDLAVVVSRPSFGVLKQHHKDQWLTVYGSQMAENLPIFEKEIFPQLDYD